MSSSDSSDSSFFASTFFSSAGAAAVDGAGPPAGAAPAAGVGLKWPTYLSKTVLSFSKYIHYSIKKGIFNLYYAAAAAK